MLETEKTEEFFGDKPTKERVALLGLITPDNPPEACEASLDELERLVETAGGEAVIRMTQTRKTPDGSTFLGRGKIRELADLCRNEGITLAVCDSELSPSKIRNIEDALDSGDPETSVRVIDRSMLILDIFALHALSAEGKLQVELAQLKYTVPRLIGQGTALSRQQGGSIAMRGPGETKLETDRRHIRRRMVQLEEELALLDRRRETQRRQRERSGICKVAIVGYTNAGKSTLLNRLTAAGVLSEDKLFATLDPTARRFLLPDGSELLLVDTVGFIRNLPHHLIRAFRSTLDEAVYADIILMMTDASDREAENQLEVTQELLEELGAADKPTLCVFNKCDREAEALPHPPASLPKENVFYLSAMTGEGVPELVGRLQELVNEKTARVTLTIPLTRQDLVAKLYRSAKVESLTVEGENTVIEAICDSKTRGRFREWLAPSGGPGGETDETDEESDGNPDEE